MLERKSQKELAFLEDLYVATDWGERFAELVDEHIALPNEGRALYLAAGTGAHALALKARAGDLKLLCVDENEECLELARTKAVAVNQEAEFRREELGALSFHDDEFDLVLGNGSMVAPPQLPKMLAEMARVARPGASVAWWLATASSFGEFFSIYWEALLSAGLDDQGAEVEKLILERPTVQDVEKLAEHAGLEGVTSWTNIEEFDYESAEQFFNSPLITDFLLPNWLRSVPEEVRTKVVERLASTIDQERHDADFSLTLKATLVIGKKSRQ